MIGTVFSGVSLPIESLGAVERILKAGAKVKVKAGDEALRRGRSHVSAYICEKTRLTERVKRGSRRGRRGRDIT